jgi:UDP-N-acetylglucosamine--N-acetylmuramyl-(pentapeptide) pyrophosphoryl-undecaprenol N-acetylglucosamine transferase
MGGAAVIEAKEREMGAEGSVVRSGPEIRARRQAERVLMVAGGTGGHIFPLLAVAAVLRSRRPEMQIEFLGTNRPLEARMIPAAGYPLRPVRAAGLKGIRGWERIRNLFVLPGTAWQTARALRSFKPEVVVGIGGYLAGPVMLEAALARIPTVLIEPNAVPGFTNRALAPFVTRAAVGFERAARRYGSKAIVTGHAVRKEFFAIAAAPHVSPYTLLIAGGSLGARVINRCLIDALPIIRARRDWTFIHQTGEADYNAVRAAYEGQGVAGEVRAFIDDVPAAFERADLVISRSGATAVAELAVAGKASVLVPFPAAADQHQLENARSMAQAGAARVIEQRELTPERLVAAISDLLSDRDRLVGMERAAKSLAHPDAAEKIADLIEELCRR